MAAMNPTCQATWDACRASGLPVLAPALEVYPGSVVVALRFDSPRFLDLTKAGYRVSPAGRICAIVQPPR